MEESTLAVFYESNVLLKNCEDYAKHPIEREVAPNEEKEEEITKSKEAHRDLPRETRIIKDHPKSSEINKRG